MNRPSEIVAFAEDWGRHPTSSQHLVRCLASDRRVLYVNSLGLRRPRFNGKDASRAAKKLLDAVGGKNAPTETAVPAIDDAPPNVDVYSPIAVSWPASRLAFRLNRRMLRRQLHREMAQRKIERPILWISLPSALPVVGTLNERALVYYCCDDFGSLVGVDHEPIMAMERRIVEQADIVFAASDVLAERLPPEKTVLIPHGTDIEHFAEPVPRAADLPSSKKIAGFYGSLDARLDFDMLIETSRRLPDWKFVLVGPARIDLSFLSTYSNIHILGPRPYNELPHYVQHWQVSMILYKYDEQIRAGNPLKMREYLAAGTPMATIRVPALEQYQHLLSICDTPAGYADAIVAAAIDTERNALRRQSVVNDSWQARAGDIAKQLDAL